MHKHKQGFQILHILTNTCFFKNLKIIFLRVVILTGMTLVLMMFSSSTILVWALSSAGLIFAPGLSLALLLLSNIVSSCLSLLHGVPCSTEAHVWIYFPLGRTGSSSLSSVFLHSSEVRFVGWKLLENHCRDGILVVVGGELQVRFISTRWPTSARWPLPPFPPKWANQIYQ